MARQTSIRCKRSTLLFGSLVGIVFAGCSPPPAPPAAPIASAPAASSPAPEVAAAPVAPRAAPREASGRRYTVTDLEALKTQRAWGELVEHLEDVAPSERDAAWKSLAAVAVVEHVRAEMKTTRDKRDLAATVESFASRYPSLASAPEFAAVRADVGIAAIEACTGARRWKDCASYVTMVEADATKAVTAAKGASKNGNRQVAMALYRAAAEKDGKTVCASDEAMAIVMEGRGMPADSTFYKDSDAVLERCRKIKGK